MVPSNRIWETYCLTKGYEHNANMLRTFLKVSYKDGLRQNIVTHYVLRSDEIFNQI